MSFTDIAGMAKNGDLRERIAACAAREGVVDPHPTAWADAHLWHIAATPEWDIAWAQAIEQGVERPGCDNEVITDGMIQAAVQSIRSEQG